MARYFSTPVDFVSYGDDAALNITDDFTVTAWIYPVVASQFHFILTKARTNTRDMPYDFHLQSEVSPQRLTITRAGGNFSTNNQFSTSGVSTGAWHHVAVSWDKVAAANDIIKFYIDGAFVNQVDYSGSDTYTATTNHAFVGNRNGATNTLPQNKYLAHVCLYNKVLTLGEILHDRAHGRYDCSNLVLYTPLWGTGESTVVNETSITIDGVNYLRAVALNRIQRVAGAGFTKYVRSSISALPASVGCALRPDGSGNDIVLRGTGTVFTSSSVSSAVLDKPASTAATDILIAFFAVNGSGKTITPPAGWTQISRVDNGVSGVSTAYFRALGNVASTTFTLTAGTTVAAFIGGYINVDNTTPIDANAGGLSGSATQLISFGSATTVTANAMLIGWGGQNAAGNPVFTGYWPFEADLSGARRQGSMAGAPVIGGPPFVGKYGSFNLPVGLWAASSGGTSVTADAVFNLEFTQNVQSDGVINAEWLTPLQVDRGANLEWLLSLQKDGTPPLEFLTGINSDATVPLEILANADVARTAQLEWLVPLDVSSAATLEWLTQLVKDATINLEILGLPLIEKDAVIPFEFLANIAADGKTNLEFGVPIQTDSIIPIEYRTGLQTDVASPLEWKIGLQSDGKNNLEWLVSLVADKQVVIEFLTGIQKDGRINLEFLGPAAVTADGKINLEWKIPVTADGTANLEYKIPLSTDGGVNLEYLVSLVKDGKINLEFTADTVSADASILLEWLVSVAADGKINWENFVTGAPVGAERITLRSVKIRPAGYVENPQVLAAEELEET